MSDAGEIWRKRQESPFPHKNYGRPGPWCGDDCIDCKKRTLNLKRYDRVDTEGRIKVEGKPYDPSLSTRLSPDRMDEGQ